MKIVKATNPPSHAVIVDTIIGDEVVLQTSPAHSLYDTRNIIFIAGGRVGIVYGVPGLLAPLPVLPIGARALAYVRIRASSVVIDQDIEEVA